MTINPLYIARAQPSPGLRALVQGITGEELRAMRQYLRNHPKYPKDFDVIADAAREQLNALLAKAAERAGLAAKASELRDLAYALTETEGCDIVASMRSVPFAVPDEFLPEMRERILFVLADAAYREGFDV